MAMPSWLQSVVDLLSTTFTGWNTDSASSTDLNGLQWPAKGSANWHKNLQKALQQLDQADRYQFVPVRDSGNAFTDGKFLSVTPSGHVTECRATAAGRLANINRPHFFSWQTAGEYEISFVMRPGGVLNNLTSFVTGGWTMGERVYCGTDGALAHVGGANFPAESGAEIWDCGFIFRMGDYGATSFAFCFQTPVLIEVIP